MNNLKITACVLSGLLFAGCAMKTKILDTPAVSMTQTSMDKGKKTQEIGDVAGQFCADSMNDKGQIGLMDEAIKDAQAKSGADYITNATFYSTGSCVSVEGTGRKVLQ